MLKGENKSLCELVNEYNEIAERLKVKQITSFRNSTIARIKIKRLKQIEALQYRRGAITPITEQGTEIERISLRMFKEIKKTGKVPGKGQRPKRWDRYKDGMLLYEVTTTEGLSLRDVHFWAKEGLMELTDPNVAEYNAEIHRRYGKTQ